jgi:hypothetical protein
VVLVHDGSVQEADGCDHHGSLRPRPTLCTLLPLSTPRIKADLQPLAPVTREALILNRIDNHGRKTPALSHLIIGALGIEKLAVPALAIALGHRISSELSRRGRHG